MTDKLNLSPRPTRLASAAVRSSSMVLLFFNSSFISASGVCVCVCVGGGGGGGWSWFCNCVLAVMWLSVIYVSSLWLHGLVCGL